MKRVIDFLHKNNQRADIVIAQSGARIVSFELFDQPPRIINADVKAFVSCAQESACQFA